jgi:hypothetical protein
LRTGSGQMRSGISAGASSVSPSGLSRSEPIFDSSLLGLIAIEQVSPVAAFTACLIRRARSYCFVGEVAQVDVDLVDAAVFYFWCDACHRRLEQAGIMTVGLEVDRQQDCIRCQPGSLHHAHRRKNAERACFIGGGGDHAAPDVVAEAEKASTSVGQTFGLLIATAADDHGQATQFGVAQEFDRRIEGVHVEMGDAARWHVHGKVTIPEKISG